MSSKRIDKFAAQKWGWGLGWNIHLGSLSMEITEAMGTDEWSEERWGPKTEAGETPTFKVYNCK